MGDNRRKRDGFGIGEAGQTPASTPTDEIEAERLQPSPRATVHCPRCKQWVPRSWMVSGMCADCYERSNDD